MSARPRCWRCSKFYPTASETCPHCAATNANHNLDAAQDEALRDAAAIREARALPVGTSENWNDPSDWRGHGPGWRGET